MKRLSALLFIMLIAHAHAQRLNSSYLTNNGSATTVVQGCAGTGADAGYTVPCATGGGGGGGGDVNLTQVGGTTVSLGQAAMAGSLPVAIASSQSALPISAATLPLPAGASTGALQTTGNTSLATIATNTTGSATSALQTTGNTSLSSLVSAQTAITPSVTTAVGTSLIAKASAGSLYGAYATSAVAGFLMVVNQATVPATASAVTPVECVPVAANSMSSIGYNGSPPEALSAGIVLLFSTTGCFTYTASSTAFMHALAK